MIFKIEKGLGYSPKPLFCMVGARGFEPPTPTTPSRFFYIKPSHFVALGTYLEKVAAVFTLLFLRAFLTGI